jgi:hypothetical protein
MKKKIMFWIVCSFLFCGVASSASLWGKYQGHDIIRLSVNGTPMQVSDVPAINYNGRTMIPIYLLDQAGVQYTWDGNNTSVDIKSVDTNSAPPPIAPQQNPSDIVKSVVDMAKKVSGYDVTLSYDESGRYLRITYNSTGDSGIDGGNLIFLSALVVLTPAEQVILFLNDSTGNTRQSTFTVQQNDAKEFLEKKIDEHQYFGRWKIDVAVAATQPPSTPSPSSKTSTDPAICSAIISKYDSLKLNKREEMNDRGLLNSSITDNALAEYDMLMRSELEMSGCPTP